MTQQLHDAAGPLGTCVQLADELVMLDLRLMSGDHVAVPYSRIHVLALSTTPGSSKERLTFKVPGVEVTVSGYSLVEVMQAMIAREVRELSIRQPGTIRRDKNCPSVHDIEIVWTER